MNEQVVGKKVYRTVVITFLDLPEGKPAIEQIVSLAGNVDPDLQLKVENNRVTVGGKINFSTFYREKNALPEESVQMMNHTLAFDYLLSIPELKAGMSLKAFSELEYLNYDLIDSNTIEVEIIFLITAVVWR